MTKYSRLYDGGDLYAHRVVYEHHFGPIPKGFHIHHKNGDMFDNRPENLEALSPADHRRSHSKSYRRGDTGEWLKTCYTCVAEKPIGEFYAMANGHRRDCKPCQHKIVNAYNRMKRKNLRAAEPVRDERADSIGQDERVA